MTARLASLGVFASDPAGLARFWERLLGWDVHPDGGCVILPTDRTGFSMRFLRTDEPKVGLNQLHFHLTSPAPGDQERTVSRALELGARHLDVGQLPEESHVVLADPDGNEFCVIEPGNSFLAGTDFLGELACDGSRAVGCFWADALGWPLVWDEGEETAIRSPIGGPILAWGGPPFNERSGRGRVRFELAVSGRRDHEVERLQTLGATLVGSDADGVLMADPDGNEFLLLA